MMNLKKLHNNWRKGVLLSACFVLTLSVLPSCKKTSSKFGTEALNVDDLLAAGGVDTFQLKTSSVLFDTLATDNQVYGTLGAYHDPKFGIVNASIYTQFSIAGSISMGTAPIVDSVVLSLNYGGYYGKLDPQTFEVYQLADALHKDSVYKRNTVKATMGSNLVDPGSATQTPVTDGKVIIADSDGDGNADTLNPQLRLKLSNALGQQFLDDMAADNPAFESSEAFLSSGYFKGLKINVADATPSNGKGAVLYFNLGNAQTKMTIYYKLAAEPSVSRNVALIINSSCGDFNHVDIDNSGYHIADVLANPINGQSQFYSQSFNVIPKIELPTIKNVPGKSVINNALLYLPIAYQTGNVYYPTQTFLLAYLDGEDFTLIGYNGAVVTATYDNNQKAYVVDLRHYIQELVSGKKENSGIYLIPQVTYFNCTADRVVFNGPASSYKTKPKLVIKYTEFK
ncbi:DUF4270 family protein [Fluviicola chungangensis]|uniref:DUF4270 domain-containing protein n=1 Tax=Fluviicola chungangensis TaxID=2597671 RepID=A0A556MNN3_9FLAO|nr:DUF4270 family protein [Fluviicola chungangensis]TSJ41543.1 DUF4270 domain-containing protein [Fluviicola chungangensis]